MKIYVPRTLPPSIQSVFEAPPSASFLSLVEKALFEMNRLTSADVQSEAGIQLLRFLQNRGNSYHQDLVDQALGTMNRFPNFARPRARIALKALHRLSEMAA